MYHTKANIAPSTTTPPIAPPAIAPAFTGEGVSGSVVVVGVNVGEVLELLELLEVLVVDEGIAVMASVGTKILDII